MFYYVYLLHLKNGNIYTGSTADLRKRVSDHIQGKVRSTRYLRPVKLIHYEAYLAKEDAVRRERFLKSSDGKALRRRQLSILLSQLENQKRRVGRAV